MTSRERVEEREQPGTSLLLVGPRSGCHPWLHLYYKMDCAWGAQIAHCGFDGPGGASYFHHLHHSHYECNYGDAAAPFDWLFGTFEDGSKYAPKRPPCKDGTTIARQKAA